MATRLSYLLWGSAPDDELLAAAEQGRLATRDDVAAQVARMTGAKFSDRVRAVAASFHQQWLGLDAMDRLEKDTKVYKDWDVGVLGRLQDETARFLDDVWQNGDVTALLTAPYTFVDGALAKYYGLTQVPAAAPTQKVALDGSKRGGLLTLGGVMAMIAKANQTAPVQRGRFVRERLMCMHLPDPDRSLKIVPPALDANLTTRERFSRHATDPACAGCHAMMDPVGLGLENFDGAGKYRDTDNGKPIDASGELRELNGDGKFTGAVGLGKLLASRDEVRACVVGSWFRYGYGRVEMAGTGDDCVLQGLRKRFADGGYRLKDLLVALTDTDAFQTVRVSSLGGAP
jgi:hypothetical protein